MADLLFPPRVIRVVDFEATGQEPPESGSIIEVGWCDLIETQTGWVTEPLPRSLLVKPTTPMLIEAIAIHHLLERDVIDGLPRDAALAYIAGGENVVAFAAHGAAFEKAMWPEQPLPWIDTYKLGLKYCPDSPRHSNQVLRYYLGLDLPAHHAMPPHRAGPDAYVTAHTLATLLNRGVSLDEAIEVSSKPGLLARVPFGQHRGKRWSEVDDGLLHWTLGKDFGEDVLYTVRVELERREAEYRRQAQEEDASV